MPTNENMEHSEKNNEGPVEEWRIHAVARHLEEAMHFEARPEFNAELRDRLLTEIKAAGKSPIPLKNRPRRNWPPFLALPGWQTAVSPWLAILLVMVSLVVVVNLNLSAQPAPAQVTATVIPEPEAGQDNPTTATANEAPKKGEVSSKVGTAADYWDEFQVRNQINNRAKKDTVVTSVVKQNQEFNNKFKNGPLPVP